MFNKKDASFEIAQSMEKALVSNAVDKQTQGLNKLAEAMEHLNAAAEIFDDAGLRKYAEVATQLLESLAAKKSKKKPAKSKKSPVKSKKPAKRKSKKQSPKSDPSVEGLTSEKMVDNLEHKGWVFNADDGWAEDKEEDEYDRADKALRARFEHDKKRYEEFAKRHPLFEDEDDADDNYARHGDDCMCSMCMDADDDMNYSHHGDDCMCSMCMDVDDVNDAKLGVAGPGMGFHSETPERYRSMAKHYTAKNEFRKAEEAMKKALELEELDKMQSDDFNFDFDTSRDSGYHVHRNPEKGYHLNDFEDEVELPEEERKWGEGDRHWGNRGNPHWGEGDREWGAPKKRY